MSIVSAIPWSRVNDRWVRTARIDATPVRETFRHPLIPQVNNLSDMNTSTYGADYYSKIALDIVAEGVYHYPYVFITEKTIRPISNKRMFIILGPANTLSVLHKKGFETFGDFIDESYDTLSDPEERFLSVIKEIENFCAKDLEEIKQYYCDNKQKFDHNSNRLLQLHREELEQLRSTL